MMNKLWTNRRNWRRQAWTTYQLDNPSSTLFLEENNQFIILNEGVITFGRMEMENNYPFLFKDHQKIVFVMILMFLIKMRKYEVYNHGQFHQH